MIRILLIRHGSTGLMGRVLYGRMPGVHISDLGRREVETLSAAIRTRYQLTEIVSSPLERAVETAECLAGAFGVQVRIDEGFTELDYGDWMGMKFDDIRELESWRHYNRSRSTCVPPRGESMLQVQARAWSALERILDGSSGQANTTVAVVSHGDVIRALLVLLLGMPLDNIHRFDISPGSLSEVTFDSRFARVISMNQTFSTG